MTVTEDEIVYESAEEEAVATGEAAFNAMFIPYPVGSSLAAHWFKGFAAAYEQAAIAQIQSK